MTRSPRSPKRSAASECQVLRWSASERGSCFACRVSRFARCAKAIDSFSVGGRPCCLVNSPVSSATRSSMSARRLDHRFIKAASTPAISRTGRFPPGRGTSTNLHAELRVEVGFEGGVVGLGGGDDVLVQDRAVDRKPLPVAGLDLVRHRDVGVEIRIPGP